MKETSIIAPVFKCSKCNYWSLHKTSVDKHIAAKCPDAKLLREEKVVKHQDPNNERDDITTLYQCSKCSYTSYASSPAKTHIKKCPGAELISEKRKLSIEDVPPKPNGNVATQNITTNNGIAVNNGDVNQTIINLHITMNTREEYEAMVAAIAKSIDSGQFSSLHLTFADDPSKVPAIISKAIKEADPRLDNKTIIKNDVVCKESGAKMPKVKHAKTQTANLMFALRDALNQPIDQEAMDRRLKDALDSNTFKTREDEEKKIINEPPIDFNDVCELRSRLLPCFFDDNTLEQFQGKIADIGYNKALKEFLDEVTDNEITPSDDFYLSCAIFMTDPEKFRKLETPGARQVRVAAKIYLDSLDKKQSSRGRPTNAVIESDIPATP